jgi:anaerobic ribonucleoside-triphosphate reductase
MRRCPNCLRSPLTSPSDRFCLRCERSLWGEPARAAGKFSCVDCGREGVDLTCRDCGGQVLDPEGRAEWLAERERSEQRMGMP